MTQLDLVALVVREYEPAIDFFVNVLHFTLAEDLPSLTNDGRPKRWVVVRPPGGGTGVTNRTPAADMRACVAVKSSTRRKKPTRPANCSPTTAA